MRLAIVSPLPPSPTGIADYTIDVARAVGRSHTIELFHDQDEVASLPDVEAFPIAELPQRSGSAPYAAVIYQMGNGPAHDFMYDWMEKVPGIVVLHDLVLHHAYARRYLDSAESRAYAADPSSHEKRERAAASHRAYREAIGAIHPALAERLQEATLNSTGDLLPYAYPLFEPAVLRARAVGAHNAFMVEAIAAARPDLPCQKLAMPVQETSVSQESMARLRARLGLSDTIPVVGCFGLVTREKRIETVARAVRRIAELHPQVRLLLAGGTNDPAWLSSLLERTGVSSRTVVSGRLTDDDFAAAIALTTVVVHLRYPTARETSAALLRVMAQGRPVVIADLANQSEIPEDVAVRVDATDEEGGVTRGLDQLLRDPASAEAMGGRAQEFARREHSSTRTAESYERLLNSVGVHYSPVDP